MATRVDPAQIGRARKGDVAAFEALVEARVGPMTRTAMAILGREDEALDAVQDALVIAWRELASIRDPAAFDAWLARILVNRCMRGLRRVVPRRGREIPVDQVAATADEPASLDARVTGAGGRDALERAFERLTVDERTILVLHHLDGRPLTEIAAVLKVPVETAESRLFASRRSLDWILEQEGGR
jgi:RNA polymerase sigma-70 factor (ECF subfamily)